MKKKLSIISLILIFSVLVFITFAKFSNPICIDGVSISIKEDGKNDVVFHIYNKGLKSVTIEEFTLNNKNHPKGLALGISYDTQQLVQSGTNNPLIKFMKIDSELIEPRLTNQEMKEAIKRKEMTPIHYGIRVEYDEEPIESMTIKYQYFGFAVTKKYSLERWNLGTN
ncbi:MULTISPECIES: hypothetical protein [unclassified Bacillus (in: firmicutes)]|uniref:hypothetical protein n=1 Tax=unclassified Bacillus (in: firmicutes) TaxID=185979 RepID=UPI0008EEAD17|nr:MULTISPECIES: hypothetical protein [unclassified Bacillus (in: firmicutes)]SFA87719.1 hypothetical protein SAMN02799634_102256 [Bacillus sp. UNCCL13]SFQ84372.1 hypothetical protein SAMN04488577_2375 [Bacillus sp. cl95]